MKRLLFGCLKVFLLVNIVFFNSGCPEIIPHGENEIGSISGIVIDINRNPIADVKIKIGNEEVYSDNKGLFSIEKVIVGTDQVIYFSKPNYITNQKLATIELGENTVVIAALGTWDKSESINPAQDNTITVKNSKIKLSANSIVDANGTLFTGTVTANVAYFDPTSDNFENIFPGDFKGEDLSGQEVQLASYGLINLELTGNNQTLQLASGSTAEITFLISDSFKNNAPNTVALCYFDEAIGIWKERSTATMQNGFSKISGLMAPTFNSFFGTTQVIPGAQWLTSAQLFDTGNWGRAKGRVVCKDGSILKGALVVCKGSTAPWIRSQDSRSDGSYSLKVKSGEGIRIHASAITNNGIINFSQTIQHTTVNGDIDIADLVIDCNNINTNPTDTTSSLNSSLYDVNYDYFPCFAVGGSGKILKYDLSKKTWSSCPAATTQDFYSLDRCSNDELWVVGSKGVARRSTDNGQSWNSFLMGTDAHLYDVEFYNGYYGWIVGTTGKIFKTSNGGDNWKNQTSGTVQTLYDVSFVSKYKGWICGSNGTILYTNDGGNSWKNQTSTTLEDLKGIYFINNQKGWAVGENGKIIRTINGGQTWDDQSFPGLLEDLNGIDFADLVGGVIVGNNGTVLKTGDGGENWTNESIAKKNNLEAVDFMNNTSRVGMVVGDDNDFKIEVTDPLRSKGWTRQNDVLGFGGVYLRDVKALTNSEAWSVGDYGVVLHTTNSGTKWNVISTGNSQNFNTIEVFGVNIWIGGVDNTLLKSTDYGSNWKTIQNIPGGKTITKISFTDKNNGWCILKDQNVENSNEVLKTTDGGLNWTSYNNLPGGNTSYYSDFYFSDKNSGMVLNYDISNDDLVIYSTEDGGNSWNSKFLGLARIFDKIHHKLVNLNNDLSWVASPLQLFHIESGKNWISDYIGLNGVPISLDFSDFQTGWLINTLNANEAYLHKTIDGGKTWVDQGADVGGDYNHLNRPQDVDMVDNNTGWVVGANGSIFYTTTGGE